MVGIEGHLMNPAKVNYIGPVLKDWGPQIIYYFRFTVDGESAALEFDVKERADKVRELMTRMPGLP